jgi:hypothetical protein
LPIFYVLLARTGKTIHEVNLVDLDRETFKPLMSWLPKKPLAALLRV